MSSGMAFEVVEQLHPLTRVLLLNVPDHHREKYPQAVATLNRCSNSLSPMGTSLELANSIETAQLKVKDLQRDIARKRVFLTLLEESCYDLVNGADPSIKEEVKNLLEFLMLAKLGSKGRDVMALMGIPPEVQCTKISLSLHSRHVLQLVIAEKIKERAQDIHLRKEETHKCVIQKLLKISNTMSQCEKTLAKQESREVSKSKKNMENIESRVKYLIDSHNLEYLSLKKKELEICKLMLGPKAAENIPLALLKLKEEHEGQVKSNEEKRQRLDLFESLGSEFKTTADKYLDMEKKIKYTKITLNQLDAMFK